jgi:tetratricopeptide (TPR) repeat protein
MASVGQTQSGRRIAWRTGLIVVAVAAVCLQGCGPGRTQRATQHVDQGQRFLEQGLSESALAAFTMAIEVNPRLTDAHMGVGDVHRQRGNYAEASKAYEEATRLQPNSFDAHYYLALMQQLMGRVNEAIKTYLRALTINPDSYDANKNLASAYLQLGRPTDALPYAERAVYLHPGSQIAWANLAATQSLLGQFDKAVDSYRQATELGEYAEPVLLGLADAHIRLGNYERAMITLESLIRTQPSATAYERLGYAQFKLRRFTESLASFRSATAMDENDPASLNGLGVCLMTLYIQGGRTDTAQRDEALDAWRKSLRLKPDQPRILDLMSRYQRL